MPTLRPRKGAGLPAWLRGRPFRVALPSLLVACAIAAAAWAGAFRSADDILLNLRFSASERAPTGNIVFVDIDAASLQAIGVWPWPRTIYARIVDRLMELGAGSVAFDVDFSAASSPQNDAAFAAALDRAGGYVALAGFEQPSGADGRTTFNLPIPSLAVVSSLVCVEIPTDSEGWIHDGLIGRRIGGAVVPSVASWLAHIQPGDAPTSFGVDFSIDARKIDRVSVASLLDGSIDAARLRGRDVVVGASALELRDLFFAPRFGMIPGGIAHILAAETLKQGRAMRDLPPYDAPLVVLALAALAALASRRFSGAQLLIATPALLIGLEGAALLLQQHGMVRAPTAAVDLSICAFALITVLVDLRLRRRLLAEAAQQRDETRAMLSQAIADNFNGIVVLDETRRVVLASRLAQAFMSPACATAKTAAALPPALRAEVEAGFDAAPSAGPRQVTTGETVVSIPGGGDRTVEYVVTTSSIEGEKDRRVACLTFRDVTERRAQVARLAYLASHDPLTGALNGRRFVEAIGERVGAVDAPEQLAIVSINLRRFNSVNEIFGHAAGDAVLKSVAARLREAGFATVARLGGDNFAVALEGKTGEIDIGQICETLAARLGEPYPIAGGAVLVGANFGAALSGDGRPEPDRFIAQASIALSSVKAKQGDAFAIFTPEMEDALREKQGLEADMRRGLGEGQFHLAYQPQFDLRSRRLIGAEALMRWRHPRLGDISPATFIPLAEETGVIAELGRYALESACRAAAAWPDDLRVSVNVSPAQFLLTDVEREVAAALASSGLAPSRLTIEITESLFVSGEAGVAALLDRLRARGVAVSLDDFGTGYSSLGYLGRMPVDEIKIDRKFVMALGAGGAPEAVVRAILALARALGKSVIAEGVETLEQALLLTEMGCPSVQGYFFGRPMPGDAFAALAAETTSPSPVAKAG
jgi:diguanylate cyclase (GGDEF)-like protein